MKTKTFFKFISDLYRMSKDYQIHDFDFNPALWSGFCKFGLLDENSMPKNYVNSRIEICIDKYKGTISAYTYCVNDYNIVWPNDNEHTIEMHA